MLIHIFFFVLGQATQIQTYTVPRRYFHFGAGLVSQCSLHSCTSSELSAAAPTTVGESSASYTTSLSTDTLYWDGSGDMTRQASVKSSNPEQRYHPPEPVYVQYTSVKPKSWDNLATKAFGGYGFGYGYIDTRSVKSPRAQSKSTQCGRTPQYTPHAHRKYFQPTKSTENLLSISKHSQEALTDSSVSCECLEIPAAALDLNGDKFFASPRPSLGSVSPTDPNFGYYSATRKASKGQVTANSEATRL